MNALSFQIGFYDQGDLIQNEKGNQKSYKIWDSPFNTGVSNLNK